MRSVTFPYVKPPLLSFRTGDCMEAGVRVRDDSGVFDICEQNSHIAYAFKSFTTIGLARKNLNIIIEHFVTLEDITPFKFLPFQQHR